MYGVMVFVSPIGFNSIQFDFQAAIDAEVKELVSLKAQFKDLTGEDLAGGGRGGKKGGKEDKKAAKEDKKQQKGSNKGASGEGAGQKEDGKREVKKVTR